MEYNLNITEGGEYIFSPIIEVEPPEPPQSDVYVFDKKDIVEGVVSKEVALNNKVVLNDSIKYAKENGYLIFSIDNIHAYFEVGANSFGNTTYKEAIQIPSDFHFKMGDNCTLRVQPNDRVSYGLLTARNANNVTISGGHLIGDKYEHTYTTVAEDPTNDGNTHEFGTGVYFISVTNAIVDNVIIDDMTGDCIQIHSDQRRNNDGSPVVGKIYSGNILIKNCTLRGARRNNLSFIDVHDLILENSYIANAGEGGDYSVSGEGYSWKGALPRCGIDMEATRGWDEDLQEVEQSQVVTNIIVRNNTFTNSHLADINLYTCDNVEIYNNNLDSSISTVLFAQYIDIHDNIIIHNPTNEGSLLSGISIKKYNSANTGESYIHHVDIYNNTITGFRYGIGLGGENHNIHNNTITESTDAGILLKEGDNNSFYDNTITSSVDGSKGYYQQIKGDPITNISLVREDVSAVDSGFTFNGAIATLGNEIVIDDCTFVGGNNNVNIRNSSYIIIKNSTVNPVLQKNNNNITLTNNN